MGVTMFDEGGAGKAFSHAWAMSGARIDLEPLRAGHAEEMAEVLGDPALHRFIGGAPEGVEQPRARYARLTAGSSDPAVWQDGEVRWRAELAG
ncbi:GNAT family N-acetyltransferase [Streptomyces sp. NPDC059994]|uniref:GNAT family N-acetyltransferase n=1 Tax=Streptomyces sp. NPDC059994 TaxID=3347029 RepID=UPI0036AAB9BB